jgi:hypothetical protein
MTILAPETLVDAAERYYAGLDTTDLDAAIDARSIDGILDFFADEQETHSLSPTRLRDCVSSVLIRMADRPLADVRVMLVAAVDILCRQTQELLRSVGTPGMITIPARSPLA